MQKLKKYAHFSSNLKSSVISRALLSLFLFPLLSFATADNADAASSMSLTKSSTTTTYYEVGQVIPYSYFVTNTGTDTLTNIVINDNKIGNNIPCTSSLAPTASITCTANYTVTNGDISTDNITNTATTAGINTESQQITSAPSTVIIPKQSATLSLTKSATPNTYTGPGQNIQYNFLVTNTGNVEITNIAIADNMFSGVTCPVTTLAANASTTCTYTYTTQQINVDNGSISNTATASGSDPQNNTVTSPASSVTVNGPTRAPALNLVKTATQSTFNMAGDVLNYTYTVTNTGNVTIGTISSPLGITDNKIPSGITCNNTILAPLAQTTCAGTYTTTLADVNAQGVTNTAFAHGMNPEGSITNSNNSSATVAANQTPSLSITKSASPDGYAIPGTLITYTYTVMNTGNDTLSQIAVTDDKITSAITCAATSLPPIQQIPPPPTNTTTTTCTGYYTTTQADVDAEGITNTGTASGKNTKGTTVNATDTITVPGTVNPSISLLKSTTTTSYNAIGDQINFTYDVTNTGNQTLFNVGVNDTPTPTCLATTLAPKASTTCSMTYTVTAQDMTNGKVTDTATAFGNNELGATSTSSPSSSTIYAVLSPGISLQKSGPLTPFSAVGTPLSYTYVITNTGNTPLANIAITDNKIPSMNISCPTTNLNPGSSTITCTGTYSTTQADIDAGGVTNTASVSSTSNTGTSEQTTVTSAKVSFTVMATQMPAITLDSVTSSPASFSAPNQYIQYTYTVTNNGNDTLKNIKINFTSGTVIPANLIDCPASIAPGQTVMCTASYETKQADVDAGSVANSVTVSGTNGVGTTVTSSPSLPTSVPATPEPGLSVTKSTQVQSFSGPNQTIEFSYLVKNIGNETISSIQITDDKIPPTFACGTGSLAPSTSTTCTKTYTTTQADMDAGMVTNSATASGNDPHGNPIPNSAPSSVTVIAVGQSQSVLLTKSSTPTTYTTSGTVITYNYLVANTGNVTITAFTVTDPHTNLSPIMCTETTIAPGTSTNCTATYTTTEADVQEGSISNTGTVNATTPLGTVRSSSSLTVQGPQTPSVSLSKSANTASFSGPNQSITYFYLVTNTGNVALNTVTVTDPHMGLGTITCPVSSLAVGASTTCSATYTTTPTDVTNGSISNTGTVTASSPDGNVTATSSLTIDYNTGPTLSLTLAKSANISDFNAIGTPITYSYLVTNTGTGTFTFTLADPHAGLSGFICPTTTLSTGQNTTCTATYTTTQADVDAASISNTATATIVGTSISAVSSLTIVSSSPVYSVSLVKTGPTTKYTAPGQFITYSFKVTNTGNQTLNTININDSIIPPANISCPSSTSLAPQAYETCTGTYETTQGDVDAGVLNNSATATALSPQGNTATSSSSSWMVDASQTPLLSITKSTPTTTFNAVGDTIPYSYLVKNTGNVSMNSIYIVDSLVPTADITCPATTIAPFASLTCTTTTNPPVYQTTQADLDRGYVTNSSQAGGKNPAGVEIPLSTPASVATVYAQLTPSLTITKTTPPNQSFNTPGYMIPYTYTVTNTGNDTISNIQVTDDKLGAAFTCGGVTTLAPNASTTCTVDYSTTQGDVDNGGVTNTASAAGTNPQSLPVKSATASTTVPSANVASSITLNKGVDPTTPNYNKPNQIIKFTFAVENTGQSTLSNITISDPLIADVTCLATTLAPSASTQCTGNYRTTQNDVDNTFVLNTATVTGTIPAALGGGTVSANSQKSVPATLNPGISIAKSSTSTNYTEAGQIIRYNYVVKNTGNDVLNIRVTDNKIVAPNTVTCPVSSLEPNFSTTCYADYTTVLSDINSGTLTNLATASGVNPNDPNQQTVNAQSTVTLPAVQEPGMSLLKTAANSLGQPITTYSIQGEVITYSYKVTNTGNDTLSNIVVKDNKISGTICTIPSLDPGNSFTCTKNYTITLADMNNGSLTNIGTASGVNPKGAPISAQSTVTLSANLAPSIILAKTPSSMSYNAAGEVITYTFKVTNTGNDTIKNISITDPLITTGITCLVTSVNPNAFITCTGRYTITLADIDNGSVSNTATANGVNNQGTHVSASASAMITATPNPMMSLQKTSTSTSYSVAGETINYDYTVTNTGNDTLYTITVTDTTANGPITVMCPTNSIAPGQSLMCTGTYITTVADVVQGSIINTAQAFGKNSKMTPVQSTQISYTLNSNLMTKLTLVKTADKSTFSTVGTTITYTYKITNTGNDIVTNVSATDTNNAVNCPPTPPNWGPNDILTCTGTYLTTQEDLNSGGVTNDAQAFGLDQQSQLVKSALYSITVPATETGELDLTKTVPPGTTYTEAGQLLTYTFDVTNNKNITINGLIINDPLITTGITCVAYTLQPGASTTCTGSYTTTPMDVTRGYVVNMASASGNNNTVNSAMSEVTVNYTALMPSLTLSKSSPTANYSAVGQPIYYQYLIHNTGNSTLMNFSIMDDHIPSGDISCPPGVTLPVNEYLTCTATYLVTAEDLPPLSTTGNITNKATASAMDQNGALATSNQSIVTVNYLPGGGNISVTKSANVDKFVTPGTPIIYTYVVSNPGITTLTDVALTDSIIGMISCPTNTLDPGAQMTCTANYKTTAADAKQGSITNIATATALTPSGLFVTAQATDTVGIDAEFVRERTLAEIRNFLMARAQLILSAEPDRRRNINRLNSLDEECQEDDPDFNIRPAEDTKSGSLYAAVSMSEFCIKPTRFDLWAEVHASYYQEEHEEFDRNGEFGVAYLGLDYLVSSSLLVGVLSEFDTINQEGSGDDFSDANGQGWMVGPYLTARLLSDVYLHARAAWGGSDNEIDPLGFYTDSFNTIRSLYNAEIVGDWYNEMWRISPALGVTYFTELQQKYTNAIGIDIPSQRINLGQINLGPEFAYTFFTDDSKEINLRLSLQGLYNFDKGNDNALIDDEDLIPISPFSGRVKLGTEILYPSGISITPMVLYDGVGDEYYDSIQIQLQVNVPLW